MKTVLFLLLLIHGLIHGMGFVKDFGLAELTALSQPISRPMGLLWLLAALLFLSAGVSLLMNAPAWWMFALAGILLSQIVIDLSAGQSVLVAVSGFAGEVGSWVLNVTPP